MKYHDALRYLYGLVDYEKRRIDRYSPREFKIERVQELLEVLGNPQNQYPTLHIAGTKGKGSVSAIMALCAQNGGLRTGLYTSPHLHTYRERIQINGTPITRNALAALVEEVKPVVDARPALTTFEVVTALAFLYFEREGVDLAVMEVGLGGRLDATNVITPEVSIITSLSLDHTNLLGNTLAEIAFEKAGIIKPGVPVVSAPQKPEALTVLETIAAERNADLTVVGRDWLWDVGQRLSFKQTLKIECSEPSVYDGEYALALLGDFQLENAAVAIAATAVLAEQGHDWATPQNIRDALENVSWPGRMEILNKNIPMVVDCAHNPYSAEKLAESMKTWFPDKRWILIFGASNDKDIVGMLRALLPISEQVIATRSYHPRAAAPYALADMCADLGPGAEIAIDPQTALEQACVHLTPDLGILATGSNFLVADIREAWAKQENLDIPMGDWVDEPW
jgi:dihydrofolate synthase/folylpolyglutamate synthase